MSGLPKVSRPANPVRNANSTSGDIKATVTAIAVTMVVKKRGETMIIKGNVQTMKGPVSIASLMEGDMVITAKRIPSKVVRVTKKKIKTGLQFKRNTSLVVKEGTAILTAYGMKEAKAGTVMMHKTSSNVPDELVKISATEGYELVLSSGDTVLVNGYGVEVEHD